MSSTPPTALDLGQAIQRGELDPVAVTKHSLAMARESEAVFISLTEERALAEAQASADRQRLGGLLGPLDGVPIAWKDLIDIQGTLTTGGSKILAQSCARSDADAVRHASGAGMVGIGKTNLAELAYSGLGLNPHYGTPHHTPGQSEPRAPGGSSSGSAIAVAKGIVPVAIGTDTAGSLRVPAAFNGLVAYRPSQARHTRQGVTPLARNMDTLGAMATTLEDCLAVDDAIRGRPVYQRLPSPPEQSVIILDTTCLEDPRVASSVRRNLENSAERLAQAGFRVVHRHVVSINDTLNCIAQLGWLGAVEAYTEYRHLLESDAANAMDPRVRHRLQSAARMTPDNVVTLYRHRQSLKAQLREELSGAILLTPTVAHTAPLLGPLEADAQHFAEVNLATLRMSMVASFLDSPAVVLPNGTDEADQHTSLQLSAPCGEDEPLLRVALSASRYLSRSRSSL